MDCRQYLADYKKRLIADGKRLLDHPMPEITREAFEEYFLTGNRVHYEKKYFGRREFLTIFGCLSIINDDDASSACVLTKLFDVIEDILKEKTWILPPHGSMDNYDKGTPLVDLFAAETAGTIGEILGLIKENPQLKNADLATRYQKLCDEFYAKWQHRIYSFFTAADPCAWWEYGDMNWATVCAGNVGLSAYYLTKLGYLEPAELIKIMKRVSKSMASYIAALGEEGVCTEGVGYYKYGVEYFLAWHEVAKTAMAEYDFSLELPEFHAVALFPQKVSLGQGHFVNFSDSVLKNPMKMGLLAYLSSCYDDVRLPDDYCAKGKLALNDKMEILGGAECHRFAGALRDYLWVSKYGDKLTAGGSDLELSIYPQHNWYIRRFADGTCIYAKGGHNDEPHNHNDIGSFAFLKEGQEILCDLGPQEYVAGYFDNDKRYDFLAASSAGHNVPILGDGLQLYGRDHKASFFTGDKNGFEIHFGEAYGLSGDTVTRQVSIGADGSFELSDHVNFETASIKEFTEVFIFRTKPEINGNQITVPYTLNGATKSAKFEFQTDDLKSGTKPVLEELPFNEHEGQITTIYRIRLQISNEDFHLRTM